MFSYKNDFSDSKAHLLLLFRHINILIKIVEKVNLNHKMFRKCNLYTIGKGTQERFKLQEILYRPMCNYGEMRVIIMKYSVISCRRLLYFL